MTAVPPTPPIRNSASDGKRTVAALEQPAVQRDRRERHERVAGVVVGERGGHAGCHQCAPGLPDDREVASGRAATCATSGSRRARRARSAIVAYGRDSARIPGISPRRRRGSDGRRRTAAPALGDAAVAVELRRPLAQPVAAVRALGDVRAHLRPAALADHEQVRAAGAHEPIVGGCERPFDGLVRRHRFGPRCAQTPRRRSLRRSPPSPRGGRDWPRTRRPAARRRCRGRAGPRPPRARPAEPRSWQCSRIRSISRRASARVETRSECGRSTSSPSRPWRAASHLFSSSISNG